MIEAPFCCELFISRDCNHRRNNSDFLAEAGAWLYSDHSYDNYSHSYITAFYFLSLTLEKIPTGIAYAIWSAAGLAAAYMHCAADAQGEWHQVGSALDGTAERAAVQQQLLDGYVDVFLAVMAPCAKILHAELKLRCVALVGAGDALSVTMLRGEVSEKTASETFTRLIVAWLATEPSVR